VPGGRLGLFWPSRGQNWFVGAASPIGKTNPPLAIGYWLLAIVYWLLAVGYCYWLARVIKGDKEVVYFA
jgi:hypothetical protein